MPRTRGIFGYYGIMNIRRRGRTANAPVPKTGVRKDLQVQILPSPHSDKT